MWGSAPHAARQAAARSAGRPRWLTRVWPRKFAEVFSAGFNPACLTTLRAVANRDRSPVSARMTAAPTADTPGNGGDQGGQPEPVEDGDHAGLDLAQASDGRAPVVDQHADPLQRAATLNGHAAAVGEGGEEPVGDPVTDPLRAEPGQLAAHRGRESVTAQPA